MPGGGGSLVVPLGDGGADGGGVGDGLVRGVGGEQGGGGEPAGRGGGAAADLVDQAGGVIGEKLVGAAGELGVMPQVGPGFGGSHRRHRVPDADRSEEHTSEL